MPSPVSRKKKKKKKKIYGFLLAHVVNVFRIKVMVNVLKVFVH